MLSYSLSASHLAVACLIGLLCWAAFSDFLTFTIPNQVCVAITALYPLYVLAATPEIDWAGGIACGVIVFALGFVFFALRLTGGGDVKLLAAVSIWAGPTLVLPFLAVTAFAGGVVSVATLIRVLPGRLRPAGRIGFSMRETPTMRERVPYGIAIAVGGVYVAVQFLGAR
jgi:prepilin peptidase CpaA